MIISGGEVPKRKYHAITPANIVDAVIEISIQRLKERGFVSRSVSNSVV
jgi:hypothetical protein